MVCWCDVSFKTDIPLTKAIFVTFPRGPIQMICYALILQFSSVSSTPFVFLTVIHTSPPQNKHDATSVWAEDVNNYDFKACVRELKNFDGVHKGVKLVSECHYCDGSGQKSEKVLPSHSPHPAQSSL